MKAGVLLELLSTEYTAEDYEHTADARRETIESRLRCVDSTIACSAGLRKPKIHRDSKVTYNPAVDNTCEKI